MEEYMKSMTGVQLDRIAAGSDKPSPVRMRREIVSGTYGIVRTIANSLDVEGGVYVYLDKAARTAEELREAANIFNQIAEALEDNAK